MEYDQHVKNHLKRIGGQVKWILNMMEQGKDCGEFLLNYQLQAMLYIKQTPILKNIQVTNLIIFIPLLVIVFCWKLKIVKVYQIRFLINK
ncbi:metal-sensing transcriptional repressor [Bacillus sp. OTU2372]|uniref:metal-sensing transcriptional repressor n=1 Tax=Bacillus sp. OTU2372 TaxID=3043858 RepID=UPI00406CE767